MNWAIGCKFHWRTVPGLVLTVALSGCTPTSIIDGAYLRGPSNAALRIVEGAEKIESSNVAEALSQYQQALAAASIEQGFADYQKVFAEELQAYQDSQGQAKISRDAGMGVPEVFARRVLANVRAHQGMARVYLAQKEWGKAETEANEAINVMKGCSFCPYASARSLRESNRILEKVYQAQGATGKALIRKLNADLLDDHLASEGGVEDFYVEKKVLLGEASQKAIAEVERLHQSVMQYQQQQHAATANAIVGGLMAVNAGLQQGLAQSALAKSGGVMTPQVQMAQLNAQMATMGSQLFTALSVSQANANANALQASATPWAIPSFAQQLVDPKQGLNTPSIMQGFATSAAQAGGSSVRSSAEQFTRGLQALQQFRKDPTAPGLDVQVKKFADAFNSFLVLVQEVK